ncbi:hypothetical protein F7R01_00740 [Pseudomonas argentinensis]|uniref:Uncharacterized protein n=1 Tax=Phytopseudomonas argentinensis TaxID=289370 RepID=A0A1I3NUD4_9GAMM|nr:hypothetical protein [Pseudomonas argentinensis]KAB0549784.1 hypothetical protein F7R01_00740 [Pseudomonas argentinensis]SFJ12883.1 hypothetical protein SAMN05216602_4030 [Pseudomonas argentinensis]
MFTTVLEKIRASGFSGREGLFTWISRSLDKSLFILFNVTGTALFALGGAFAGNYNMQESWRAADGASAVIGFLLTNPYLAIIFGILLALAGGYGIYKDQNRLQSRLESQVADQHKLELDHTNSIIELSAKIEVEQNRGTQLRADLDTSLHELERVKSRLLELHKELIQNSLKHASIHLSFGTFERITLFNEYQEELHVIGRYSQNPIYNKVARKKFSVNQGIIGIAWRHNSFEEQHCPDGLDDDQKYCAYICEKYHMHESDVNRLRMKSCRYMAFAVMSAGSHKGVIVFESIDPGFFQKRVDLKADISKYFYEYQGMYAAYIQESQSLNRELMARERMHGPSIEDELKKGLTNG